MWKALALKELREVTPLAGLATAAYGVILAHALGVYMVFWPVSEQQDIPFVTDSFVMQTTFVSFCLAVGLAMKQTLAESMSGTWLWLLHRPMTRSQILAIKLAVGGTVYLTCAALPVLLYACWAASPRTHPSPFYWSMTQGAWEGWGIVGLMYLGGFLSAFRPGRWMGTRLLPLAGTATLTGVLYAASDFSRSWSVTAGLWLLLVVLGALVVSSLQRVGRVRDFS
ncbi:MAG TPA: hypothetical protein VFI31_19800 [Pirellulales bacterium]|nr:hypothetical protein [Pirellulales bacterium]